MTAGSDPARANQPDSRSRPDYAALAHREEPLPESAAWNILSYLLAGLVGFGLPAWFLDRWLGTSWIVLVGILLGTAVAMTTIWFRYGTAETRGTSSDGSPARSTTSSAGTVSRVPHPVRDPDPGTGVATTRPQHPTPASDAIHLEDKP